MAQPPRSSIPPTAQRRFVFPPGRSKEELTTLLEKTVGPNLAEVVLTENRSRIASVHPMREAPGKIRLRLHRSFLDAEGEVLEWLTAFVRGDLRGPRRHRAIAALRRHFEAHTSREPEIGSEDQNDPRPKARRTPLRPVGRHFDLLEIRDRLVAEHLGNETFSPFEGPPEVTWGRRAPRRKARRGRRPRRRSLRLGSYDAHLHRIRIHPVLDRTEVPLFVLESIVYHELLHAVVPPEGPAGTERSDPGGRRCIHTREFKRRERLSPEFARSEAWLKANFDRLLRLRTQP